jgi:predicted ester cyclase
MSNQDNNVAAQEHLANNINDGNVDTAVESFDEDAVDHDPAPGQGPGRAGFRDFWTTITTAFPDARIEPRHEVVADEHVVVAYTLTGTHRGEFQGISPTVKKIEISGIQIGRFEDVRIVERWGSSDELGILKQLGAVSDEA